MDDANRYNGDRKVGSSVDNYMRVPSRVDGPKMACRKVLPKVPNSAYYNADIKAGPGAPTPAGGQMD